MRYKEHTIRKLEAQAQKLKSLQRAIQGKALTGQSAIDQINVIIKEIELVVERLELEPNE